MKKLIKKFISPMFNLFYKILMFQARFKKGRKLFNAQELSLVHKALLSQTLFKEAGHMVSDFERLFAQNYGVPYAISSTSGTSAVHVALGAIDINPGDEIITAPITDLGTIIPILYQNAIPVFADVNESYTMDPKDIEQKITKRTKAIILVHLFGNTCDMDPIMEIARKRNIIVIEDCSQAHVTEYKNRYVGTIGDIGCFSFQQSKHMTTGDGGMTITSNKIYYERIKLFGDKNYARKGWGARSYYGLAPNYRMNELTAAVGIAQLNKVSSVVNKRRELGKYLTQLISLNPEIITPPITNGANHSYWQYPLGLRTLYAEPFARELRKEGLKVSPGYTVKPIYLCTEALTQKKTYGSSGCPFTCQNLEKVHEYKEGLCSKAEEILDHIICIPIDESWTKERIKDTSEKILKVAEKLANENFGTAVNPVIDIDKSPINQIVIKKPNITKVAVIGCGYIGRWHVQAYLNNQNVNIAGLVDVDITKAKELAQTLKLKTKTFNSYKSLLNKEIIDGVSICTLPATHKEITLDFLNAGINVLCEKPLAIDVNQASEMIEKAKFENLVLLTAYKFRFFEEVNRVKEIIKQGSLGKIINFRLMFGGYLEMAEAWFSKKELSGGGVIMDNGSHAFDLVRYLLGDFKIISVNLENHQNLKVEDTARIFVQTEKGAAGILEMTWSVGVPSKSYLEIYGKDGAILLDLQGLTYKYKTWNEWKRIDNKTTEKDGFSRQINHFIDSINGKDPTVTIPEDGLYVQKLISYAYTSNKKENKYAFA